VFGIAGGKECSFFREIRGAASGAAFINDEGRQSIVQIAFAGLDPLFVSGGGR
jgi:hypothetical protein